MYVYDEDSGTWSLIGRMPEPKEAFACGFVETANGFELMVAGKSSCKI